MASPPPKELVQPHPSPMAPLPVGLWGTAQERGSEEHHICSDMVTPTLSLLKGLLCLHFGEGGREINGGFLS